MFGRKCLLLQKDQLFCTKKSNFWPASAQLGMILPNDANFLKINNAKSNLKSRFRHFLKKVYSYLDIGKIKKSSWLLHAYIYFGVESSCISCIEAI